LFKLRHIRLIQRHERRLAGRRGTRSPEVKPEHQNRDCEYHPECASSRHDFLSCNPVSDHLREYGDQDYNNYRQPEQRYADRASPHAAPIASAIDLPEAQDEQENSGAQKPWTQRGDPNTDACQTESANKSEWQTTGQGRQCR
jgi:hypothetical protein